ncbi:MAG: leukotoxin LktA family filamentous adhesin [Gemmatimonadaceae bacterium]|nr:leukotoxin LktA family filamentous adhesin [Gemmatimonadaceae bacterium]
MSPSRTRARRVVAGFTAFCFFWSSVLPAQTLIVPDGNTATHVGTSGANTQVTTGTVRGQNAFNSFSRFNVGTGDTVNLHLPSGTQNLLNLVHDERTQIDGVLNAIRNGGIGGNVYIANPHGVVVGADGVVNTGALHLSTPTQAFMQRFFAAPGEPSATATTQLLDGSMPIDPEGLISIRGTVNTTTGANIRAGTIEVAGAVRADAATADVFASAVNLDGLDSAQGVTMDAGRIALAASRDVAITGTLSAEGGDINVRAAQDIRLDGPALLSASGHGANADAGSVVVVAERDTHFAKDARIEARGGDISGDGGFIELSAKRTVELAGGYFDAGAVFGQQGSILIDPDQFVLSGGSLNAGSTRDGLTVAGGHLSILADSLIRLTNTTVSSRVVNASGNSTAPSGNITLTAPTIEILGGSKIHSFADGAFGAGDILFDAEQITVEGSEIHAYAASAALAGDVTLDADAAAFLVNPFGDGNVASISLKGASLKGGTITLDALATAGYLFDGASAAAIGENDGYWNAAAFGDDAIRFLSDLRPFIGFSIAKSNASITLEQSTTAVHTTLEASSAVDIAATANSKATISTYGTVAAVGYGRSTANATVELKTGTLVTAPGAIGIESTIDNKTSIAAKVIDVSKQAKVPVDVVVAVTEAYGAATTTVAEGATVRGGGPAAKVSIGAVSTKDLSTEVEAGAGNDLLGAAVAVTLSNTRALTSVSGAVEAGGALEIAANASTDGNATKASATIGDSFFEEYLEDGAAKTPSNLSFLNKAGIIQAVAEWIENKIASSAQTSSDSATSTTTTSETNKSFVDQNGLSAAVVVANHRNEASATIGAGADIETLGDLSLLAETSDQQRLSAASETSQSDDTPGSTGKKNAASAAVIVGNFDNVATATIAGSVSRLANVDARGTLTVEARTLTPYVITWAPLEAIKDNTFSLSAWLEAIPDSNLGIPDTFFNSWAQSSAEAGDIAIAGSVNLLDYDNWANASIGEYARVNQDADFFKAGNPAPGDVAVTAESQVVSVGLSGVANFFLDAVSKKGIKLFSTGGEKGGVGGSMLGSWYANTTHAWVDRNAMIDARDLAVSATSDIIDVSIAVAGAKAGKYGFAGSFASVDVDNDTLARIDDGANVDLAGKLSLLADDYALAVNTAGAIGRGQKLSFGASVTVNDFERRTQALIGNDTFDPTQTVQAGAVDADGSVSVDANTSGSIWTAALAAAVAANESETPSAPDPADSKKSKSSGEGAEKVSGGLHVSGDVAINDIADTTRAYLNGGGKIDSGIAAAPAGGGDVPPSLAVTAANDSEIWALGGAVSADLRGDSNTKGTSVGLAGSFALNDISGTTEAFVASTQTVDVAGDARIAATRDGGIRALTASGSGSKQKSGINMAGSMSYNEIDNATLAHVTGAKLVTTAGGTQLGDLSLFAEDLSDIYAIAGAVTLGGKAGFGASVLVNEIGNETRAYATNAKLVVAGALALTARNQNDIRTLGASLGASDKLTITGVGAGNTITNFAEAWLDNTSTAFVTTPGGTADRLVEAARGVSITAEDESEIELLAAAGAGSKGAGIGASVAVNTIDNTVKASVTNAVYASETADFALSASNIAGDFENADPDDETNGRGGIRALAGAVGIGKTGGAGVAVAVNRLAGETTAQITGANAKIKARNVTVDATGEGSIAAIAAGLGAGGKVGVAGSVVTNFIGNTTNALVDGAAHVEGVRNVGVRAQSDDRITVAAGSAGIGVGGVGVGASVTVNKIDSSTTARIGNAAHDRTVVDARSVDGQTDALEVYDGTLDEDVDLAAAVNVASYASLDLKSKKQKKDVTGIAVNASATQHIENIDVNVAAGQGLGAGAAVNVNLVQGATVAEIVNADVNLGASADGDAQSVDVTAANQAYGNGFVGNVSAGGAAFGAALDTHVFDRTTRGAIVGSEVAAADEVDVAALAGMGASSFGIGGSLGGFAVAGTGSVVKFSGLTEALVSESDVEARRIDVVADTLARMHLVGGAVAIGGTVGVAGTFALGIADGTTRAYVDGGVDGRSHLWATDGIGVAAHGLIDMRSYAIGGSGAGGVGLAGVAVVNLATSTVEAYVADTDVGEEDLEVSSLDVDARGDIVIDNVAGGLAAGGTAGVGAGASVNVLKSRVAAELVDSTVYGSGAVEVTALSTNDVAATAVMAGVGGTAGIGGAATVTLLGVAPDAETLTEADKGGSGTLSEADKMAKSNRLADTGSDDTVALTAEERDEINGSSRHEVKVAVTGTRPYETVASIRNATVNAGSLLVSAQDASLAETLAGGVGAGLGVGVGGGVGVTHMRANVRAVVDATSTIDVDSTFTLSAKAAPLPGSGDPFGGLAEVTAFAGGAGLVGLGAAVAIGTVDNLVEAELAGDVTRAGTVTITAFDDTDLATDSVGAALGAAAVGVAVARSTKNSTVTARTADGTAAAHASVTAGGASLSAEGRGSVTADVQAAAGGLAIAANGADARASDTSHVTAKSGQYTVFELGGGALALSAIASPATRAAASGVSIAAGGGIGASFARASATSFATALIGAHSDINVGSLFVTASQVRQSGLASAASEASGSGGGLLFGINASESEAYTGATVLASIVDDALLDIGGDLSLFASSDGHASALVSGVSVGFLAVGANKSRATSGSTTTASLAAEGDGVDGNVGVVASGADHTSASATAGAGGVIAGAAASATTRNLSTTIAEVAAAPTIGGLLDVRAEHLASFDGYVNALSASLLGASGGSAHHDVDPTVRARVVAGAKLEAGSLQVFATNVARKTTVGAFDLEAGAGGIFGGAAASTLADVSLLTYATIDADADVTLTDTAESGGGATIAARNDFTLSDRVRLDAGGAIAIARAESAVIAHALATSGLGARARLDSAGNVLIAAGNRGVASASANAKTYGLAGAAEGLSTAEIHADSLVDIAAAARVRADGDITLTAGRDGIGRADELRAIARTDLFNKTAFPVETNPDANARVAHASRIDVAATGAVHAVQDITLIADRGAAFADGRGTGKDLYREILAAIASFFSNLFGGGDVSLDLHSGTSLLANVGEVRVDGEVAAGIQSRQELEFDVTGALVTQTAGVNFDTLDDVDLVANLIADLQNFEELREAYTGNANAQAAYDNEILRIRRQLADLGYTADPANTIPVIQVLADFIVIDDVRARGGDISVEAGSLLGNGVLDAPGDAAIRITNHGAANLRLGKLTIEDVGGRLSFNGATVNDNDAISRRNAPGAPGARFASISTGGTGGAPRIDVENTYAPEAQVDGSAGRAPDIQVTDDLTNVNGTISIQNSRGSVLVVGNDFESGPRITADTIDIDAGGDFVQSYVNGLYNIGGSQNDPSMMWASVASASEAGKVDRVVSGSRVGQGSIIAGNNVFISARYLNINGTVQSGIPDWSLDLDSGLVADIDAWRSDYIAALEAGAVLPGKLQLKGSLADPKGTIAAFYNPETDQVELEGVRIRGGYMQLFGEILSTEGGHLNVIDGFGRIDIENHTGRSLVVNSLDTGNGIEGQLLITDTAKQHAIDGVFRPVTTRYTRVGADIQRQDLVLVEGEEVLIDDPDVRMNARSWEYSPVSGQRYVWTTGQNFIEQFIGTSSNTTVLGFIPAGSNNYSQYVGPTPLSGTPLRDGEYTAIGAVAGSDYAYDFDRFQTAGLQRTYRQEWSSCNFWFFGCVSRTYYIRDTWAQGSREFHTHSVRADHAIDIEFIGYDAGELSVASDASLKLHGVVRNSTGNVNLSSSAGSIELVSEFGAVRGTNISLSAATGIGSEVAPVVTEAVGGAVSATTLSGDVALRTRNGDLVLSRVGTSDGDVWLNADGSLLGAVGSIEPHVEGRNLNLNAALGGIGTETQALMIATGTGGVLNARAFDDIHLAQETGDLALERVESLDGDVTITVRDGDLLDGNTHETRDTRAESELLDLWKDLGLVGAEAEASRNSTLDAFEGSKTAEYRAYWQYRGVREIRDEEGEITGYTVEDHDPAYAYAVSAEERAALDANGLTDDEIGAYADRRTAEYHRLHEAWGGTSYDPDYEYEATSAERSELAEGYKWEQNELRYALSGNIVFKKTTDTETSIEEPNVVGRNVTLRSLAGSVGSERTPVVIPGTQTGLTDEQRIALAAAEADDVAVDTVSETVTVLRREDVDVAANGQLLVEGRDHVYLGGEQDLNIKSVTSDGQVRIKGAEGIFDVSTDAAPTVRAGGLIVEAAHGDIGAAGDPLRIALANGTTLTARAGGSIFLDERLGNLRVASVLAKGTADLSALGGVTDARVAQDSVALNAAAIRLSSRTGDVGSAASPFSVFASTGAFGGTVAGGVYATTPTGDLRIEALKAGGDVQLRAPRSLLGVGTAPHVTGAKIDLTAGTGTIGSPDQFFSVDSNGKVLAKADTGLWFEEWNGDLQARDIGTRTGPLKIRVRNGNALFDNLYSDEVLDFDLAGGSLVVGYLEADGVDLTVRQEGATLLVGEMRIVDGARLRADRILLPKLVHTGALDTLLLDLRGNDDGLANLVDVDIESASPVMFTSLATKLADIFSTSRELSLLNATITERGDIRHPANSVIIDNGSPRLLPGPAQLFTDGDPFFLALAEAARIQTNALIVSYDDNFVVNAFSTENSVMRMTQKAMAVQDNVSTAALQGELFGGDTVDAGLLIDLDNLEAGGFWRVPGAGEFGVAP